MTSEHVAKAGLREGLLTDKQAAAYLGIEPRTVRLWRRTRGLPHVRLTPKVVRLRRSDIDQWLDARRVRMTA